MENTQEIKRAVLRLIGLTSQLQQLENSPTDETVRQLRGCLLEMQEKELKHIFDDLLP